MLLTFIIRLVVLVLGTWGLISIGNFALGTSKAVYQSTHNNLFAGATLLLICGVGFCFLAFATYALAFGTVTLFGALMRLFNRLRTHSE